MGKRIAFTGHMRSGKDVAASYLVENYGFNRVAFGDGVRAACRLMYPDIMAVDRKPRQLLQGIAQDARKYDSQVWVNWAFREMKRLPADADVVVSDLRQVNEFYALKRAGFTVVRITAPTVTRVLRMVTAGDLFSYDELMHVTEKSVDVIEADRTITNEGSLEDLYRQLDLLVREVED